MKTRDNGNTFAGCCVLLLLFVVLPIGCTVGSGIEYSTGEREGVLQKLSHKGLVWKTWEGELALEGIKLRARDHGTSGGSVFSFTVTDGSAVIDELEQNVGKKVRLYYRQTLCRLPWQGDTSYRVDGLEALEQDNDTIERAR